ncbi:hypothetical protein JW960_11995 [candidate division KSB1 bacterium]|nr:hypothetical protein [candidate division KSB1 bacterium]
MTDFTLKAYHKYLDAILSSSLNVITLGEYFKNRPTESFCIIRHDVDRKPMHALRMAELEYKMNIHASYFFRTRKHTFKPGIIRQIFECGHEIGYHYENVSDTHGDLDKALFDFKNQLNKLRHFVPVSTICMHGRPFSPYDNRRLWQNSTNKRLLSSELGIAGDVYLDIDYTTIRYISDTGRNWHQSRSNIRDRVVSDYQPDFSGYDDLVKFFRTAKSHPIIFLTHPERWSHNWGDWLIQWSKDYVINFAKALVNLKSNILSN